MNTAELNRQLAEIEHQMRDLILEDRLVEAQIKRYEIEDDRPRARTAKTKLEKASADALIEITRLRGRHATRIALRDGTARP